MERRTGNRKSKSSIYPESLRLDVLYSSSFRKVFVMLTLNYYDNYVVIKCKIIHTFLNLCDQSALKLRLIRVVKNNNV